MSEWYKKNHNLLWAGYEGALIIMCIFNLNSEVYRVVLAICALELMFRRLTDHMEGK